MKKILFAVHSDSYFSALSLLGCELNRNHYESFYYFSYWYPAINRDLLFLKNKMVNYVLAEDILRFNYRRSRFLLKILYNIQNNKITEKIHIIYRLIGILYNTINVKLRIKVAYDFIKKMDISLVVLAGDVLGYDTSCIIKAAHKNNARAIIAPLWMANYIEQADAYFNLKEYQAEKWMRLFIEKKWFLEFRKKTMLPIPFEKIIAYKINKVTPRDPWVLHSGNADQILCESKAMFDYCVREGLDSNKCKIVGTLNQDKLFMYNSENEKIKLFCKYSIPFDKEIILLAIPADFFSLRGVRSECEFTNYYDLIKFIIEEIYQYKDKYQLIISFHPSVKSNEISKYDNLLTNSIVLDDPIYTVIPLCSVMIASNSAVIQWAIACSKPVINYDVYNAKYFEYIDDKGVLYIDNKNDYCKILKQTLTNKEYYKNIESEQIKRSKYWGNLDGQALSRILEAIENNIRSS